MPRVPRSRGARRLIVSGFLGKPDLIEGVVGVLERRASRRLALY